MHVYFLLYNVTKHFKDEDSLMTASVDLLRKAWEGDLLASVSLVAKMVANY